MRIEARFAAGDGCDTHALMKTSLLVPPLFVLVAACGGGSTPAPANDPTTTTATPPAMSDGMPSNPPASATGTTGGSSQTALPASGDGKCKSAEAPAAAKDLDACKAECQKLSDQVPPGSKCIPERASCMSQCNQKYKK